MKLSPVRIGILRAALLLAAGILAGIALAGCQTDSTGKPVAQAAAPQPAPEPVSHEQAARDCWMATEHGHTDMPLDKRADVVDACIAAKMAGKPWPAAAKPKNKSKASAQKKPKAQPKTAQKPAT